MKTTAAPFVLPKPANEAERLNTLDSYNILGTEAERDYDEVTRLASKLTGMHISLVSLVADDYQWFKSKTGLDADSTPRAYSFCDHAMREPGDIFEVEDARKDVRFRENPLVNGAPHVIHYAAMPLTSDDGYGLGALCVIDDKPGKLTPQQRDTLRVLGRQVMAQLELRRKVSALEAERENIANINTELERFADVAAHDLRSPLRAMGSFAGLLKRRLKDRVTADEIEMLDHITGGATRLSNMVEGILGIAKAGQQDFSKHEVIDLPTLTGEAADLVDPEQHHLIVFDGEVRRIRSSTPALKQVILNLVSNAVKYCGKPSARIVVSCRTLEDGRHELAVSDDGPGIAERDQERIFKAFETGEDAPRVPSTGLGLALVRRVVERLDGEIALTSALGEGSRFAILLPAGK